MAAARWDVEVVDVPAAAPNADATRASVRRVTDLMGDAWADVLPVAPVTRWHESDGRQIQGWFLEAPARDGRPAPLVVEIHGGPATLYGWSLMWEWQCLVAAGISVYACNPRGSQGYGQDFCYANFGDWGDGPMRDVMAGVDSLIADGLVDADRLGVTGGSYGGYLTAWMIGHTDRFAAAVSCRGVYDLTSEMLSGDLGGSPVRQVRVRRQPVGGPGAVSPPLAHHLCRATSARRCSSSTPSTTCGAPITQAEELFTVLRSHRRPVRLMRVPDETHELTRSGAPFRRVENIERIRDWFVHYLVDGKRGLPAEVTIAAAIDIGSNSVHLLVAAVGPRERLSTLVDDSLQLGLGRVVQQQGRLGAAARRTALEAVAAFADRARGLGADGILLMGTQPLRHATDRSLLRRSISQATGLDLVVLSHDQEATLTLLGVSAGRVLDGPLLVMDVGGGSSEVILVSPGSTPVVGAFASAPRG